VKLSGKYQHSKSDINISQSSVATHLGCGGSFTDHFIAAELPVKEFNNRPVLDGAIRRQKLGGVLFGPLCIVQFESAFKSIHVCTTKRSH